MADLKSVMNIVAAATPLSTEQAAAAFNIIMSGQATPAQIGGFLMALRVRGESVDEITGAVRVMREKMIPVAAPDNAVDIVGTGGDQSGSYNVSTAAAFVVAACGVPVAKHGNRAISSKSGAADVLKALGVNIDLTPDAITRCIEQAGVGFMFAPNHHSAMKHVAPIRQELGTRTIFNLLGPLSNPANVKRQVLGVFSRQWVEPLAHVLHALGAEKAWVVHGSDGLDEITTTGSTYGAELKNGVVTPFTLKPKDMDIPLAMPQDLKGGDATENAAALRAVLEGARNPYRDLVALNAAAALVVADAVTNMMAGYEVAQAALDDGRAGGVLETLIRVSNEKV